MADQNESQPKPTSGGVFDGLKKMLFKDEFLAKQENTSQNNTPVSTTKNVSSSFKGPPVQGTQSDTNTSDETIMEKLHNMLESINEPGCDFFEVWNAAEDMGGVNPTNIQSAVTALKFADSTLDKNKILSTGNGYISKLQQAMQDDTTRKNSEKQKLLLQKNQESSNLQTEITGIQEQINTLQGQLSEKKQELNNINSKYDPTIQSIDNKVSQGNRVLLLLVQKMKDVLQIVEKNIK